jgi:hypothetical protein
MQSFEHVTDKTLRATLEGDFSEDSICQALNATADALEADSGNEDVPYKALSIREQACEDAHTAWNDEGDVAACLEALRTFWSN